MNGRDDDAQILGVILLADVRQALEGNHVEKMFFKTADETLSGMTVRQWPEVHRGKSIVENILAPRRRAFGINSRAFRIG